jgi:hypothetical protein
MQPTFWFQVEYEYQKHRKYSEPNSVAQERLFHFKQCYQKLIFHLYLQK